MKTTLPFLLLLVAFNSFAQITLEHTYNNSKVTRVKLENSGEKYYELKTSTNEVIFYNSDHTLWKTLVLPATIPHALVPKPTAEVIHISENKINPDANIEIIFVYYNTLTNVKDCKVFSENGTTLLSIPNASGTLSEITGLPDKLITTGNAISKVYSIPELVLENTYNYGNLKRIKLENSGEKYYSLDKTNNDAKIYNANHILWKTVSLPKPTNTIYKDIDFVFETKINPDALLEFGYTLSETVNNTTTYLSKIVNENNVELLTVPNSRKLEISSFDGLADKLFAELSINFQNSTTIYNLPSLTLDKLYDSKVIRTKLETNGEKYVAYPTESFQKEEIKIYNSNHSLWKTINILDAPYSIARLETINHISESKINNDSSIEIVYSYNTGLLALCCGHSSRIINEQGTVLFEGNYIDNLHISEIASLPTKMIGSTFSGQFFTVGGVVFSLTNLSTLNFDKKDQVIVFPNPAKSFFNISSFSVPIIEAKVYNMSGVFVKKENAQNITKIDVNQLPAGIYIVNLTDFNNQKSTHKITKVH